MFMVLARGAIVKRLQMSNEQRKTDGSKSTVLIMSAKVKESDIQRPE